MKPLLALILLGLALALPAGAPHAWLFRPGGGGGVPLTYLLDPVNEKILTDPISGQRLTQ
jgi:hypothetical protein